MGVRVCVCVCVLGGGRGGREGVCMCVCFGGARVLLLERWGVRGSLSGGGGGGQQSRNRCQLWNDGDTGVGVLEGGGRRDSSATSWIMAAEGFRLRCALSCPWSSWGATFICATSVHHLLPARLLCVAYCLRNICGAHILPSVGIVRVYRTPPPPPPIAESALLSRSDQNRWCMLRPRSHFTASAAATAAAAAIAAASPDAAAAADDDDDA